MSSLLELQQRLSQRDEQRIVAKLGDFEVSDDAAFLRHGNASLLLDERSTSLLGRYLKIPGPYLKSCPADFRAQTLRYWMGSHSEADTVVETLGNAVVGIYPPDLMMLPLPDVGEMLTRVFPYDAEVRTLLRDEDRLHIDITTPGHAVEVPNPDRIPGRPEVGDVTEGGVRILLTPNRARPPVVTSYLHRLVCSNGMTTELKAGEITLKARTVPEVIAEMEVAAFEILGGLDDNLRSYAATAQMPVPGSPLAFATQLMREAKLPVSVREAVTDNINQLPDSATLYDVNQAVTSVANQGVSYATRLRLQELGGQMALDAEATIRRCGTCEQLLVHG